LSGADRGDIATGTAADNDDIGSLLLGRGTFDGHGGQGMGSKKIAGVTAEGDHTRSPTA
jgi:hypothetical protein